jgi:hypothetical protein
MKCRVCKGEIALDAHFCVKCKAINIASLQCARPTNRAAEELDTLFGWFAQAHRRLEYPIGRAEETRYGVMEYTWRVFNGRYRRLSPVGKEMEAAEQYVQKYLNLKWFKTFLRPDIEKALKQLFDWESEPATEPRPMRVLKDILRAKEAVESLKKAIVGEKPFKLAMRFVRFIYAVRNMRFHGGPQLTSGRDLVPAVTIGWTKAFLTFVEHLVSEEFRIPVDDLDEYVKLKELQLIQEIYEEVMSWQLALPTKAE